MPQLPPTKEEREQLEAKRSGFKVVTQFNAEQIKQSLDWTDRGNPLISSLTEKILQLQETETRRALTQLGWIPPEATLRIKAEVHALMQNDGGDIPRLLEVLKRELGIGEAKPEPKPKPKPESVRTLKQDYPKGFSRGGVVTSEQQAKEIVLSGIRLGDVPMGSPLTYGVSAAHASKILHPLHKPKSPENRKPKKPSFSQKLRSIISRED